MPQKIRRLRVHGCKGERQHLPTSSCLTTPLFNRHGCWSTAGYRGRRALFQASARASQFFLGAQAVGQWTMVCGEVCSPAAVIDGYTATATTRNKTEQRYEHTPHNPKITLQSWGVIHRWVTLGGCVEVEPQHAWVFAFFFDLAPLVTHGTSTHVHSKPNQKGKTHQPRPSPLHLLVPDAGNGFCQL